VGRAARFVFALYARRQGAPQPKRGHGLVLVAERCVPAGRFGGAMGDRGSQFDRNAAINIDQLVPKVIVARAS
jgi:hypothetical protein